MYWAPSKRQNQLKPVDPSVQKDSKNLYRQNINVELMKILDCYLDSSGSYSSNLVTFAIQPLYAYHFC